MLVIDDLQVVYGRSITALRGLSLRVDAHSISLCLGRMA